MKTPIELITETREYYEGDPSLRAKSDTACFYFDTTTGNTCAVGRCMTTGPWLDFIGDFEEIRKNYQLNEVLRPEYHNIPHSLWNALQDWHDSDLNFTLTGLTAKGKLQIENLLSLYK